MTTVIHVERETSAPRQRVWDALDDSPGWVRWTPLDECAIEVPRSATHHEVRAVRNGRVRLVEEILERTPGHRLTYTVRSGIAVQDYLATIRLQDVENGTKIIWHTEFSAKVPGTGWLYARALRGATRQFVDGLVRFGERGP